MTESSSAPPQRAVGNQALRDEVGRPCWCMTCDQARRESLKEQGDWMGALSRPFIVCPDCGNKRCPKASHHDSACSGSNEPGQEGSFYA